MFRLLAWEYTPIGDGSGRVGLAGGYVSSPKRALDQMVYPLAFSFRTTLRKSMEAELEPCIVYALAKGLDRRTVRIRHVGAAVVPAMSAELPTLLGIMQTNLFGTDQYGYDILTRIVWGFRWTLGCVFLVAAARVLIGGLMAAKTSAVLALPFVEAASSAGAGRGWIFRWHVMPFLAEELLESFADQTVAVLQLVGRLGVFMLFVGGTVMTFDPPLLDSATGEIAGLIGLYRLKLLGARWMLAWPLASYLVVLAGMRFFASGLRERERRMRRLYDAR
jgi:ABC-type dipeptide/oligopeptide/nickel transport system permease subunit